MKKKQGELYDLEADLSERKDLGKAYPQKAAQLQATLMAQLKQMNAQFPITLKK